MKHILTQNDFENLNEGVAVILSNGDVLIHEDFADDNDRRQVEAQKGDFEVHGC